MQLYMLPQCDHIEYMEQCSAMANAMVASTFFAKSIFLLINGSVLWVELL